MIRIVSPQQREVDIENSFRILWFLAKGVREGSISREVLDVEVLKGIAKSNGVWIETSFEALRKLGGGVKEGSVREEVMNLELLKKVVQLGGRETYVHLFSLTDLGIGVQRELVSEEVLDLDLLIKIVEASGEKTGEAINALRILGEAVKVGKVSDSVLSGEYLKKIVDISGGEVKSIFDVLRKLGEAVNAGKLKEEVLKIELFEMLAKQSGSQSKYAFRRLKELVERLSEEVLGEEVLDVELLEIMAKSGGEDLGDAFWQLRLLAEDKGIFTEKILNVEFLKRIAEPSGADVGKVFELLRRLGEQVSSGSVPKELLDVEFFTEVVEQMNEKTYEVLKKIQGLGEALSVGVFRKEEVLEIVRRTDQIGIDQTLKLLDQLKESWARDFEVAKQPLDEIEEDWLDRTEMNAQSLGVRKIYDKSDLGKRLTMSWEDFQREYAALILALKAEAFHLRNLFSLYAAHVNDRESLKSLERIVEKIKDKDEFFQGPIHLFVSKLEKAVKDKKINGSFIQPPFLERILNAVTDASNIAFQDLTGLASGVSDGKMNPEVLDVDLLIKIAVLNGEEAFAAYNALGEVGKGIQLGKIKASILKTDFFEKLSKIKLPGGTSIYFTLSKIARGISKDKFSNELISVDLFEEIFKLTGDKNHEAFNNLGTYLDNVIEIPQSSVTLELLMTVVEGSGEGVTNAFKDLEKISFSVRQNQLPLEVISPEFLIEVFQLSKERSGDIFDQLLTFSQYTQFSFDPEEYLSVLRKAEDLGMDAVLKQLDYLIQEWIDQEEEDDVPEVPGEDGEWLREEVDARSLGAKYRYIAEGLSEKLNLSWEEFESLYPRWTDLLNDNTFAFDAFGSYMHLKEMVYPLGDVQEVFLKIEEMASEESEDAFRELSNLFKSRGNRSINKKLLTPELLMEITEIAGKDVVAAFKAMEHIQMIIWYGRKIKSEHFPMELFRAVGQSSGVNKSRDFGVLGNIARSYFWDEIGKEILDEDLLTQLAVMSRENISNAYGVLLVLASRVKVGKIKEEILDLEFLEQIAFMMKKDTYRALLKLEKLGATNIKSDFDKEAILNIVRKVEYIGVNPVLKQLDYLIEVWASNEAEDKFIPNADQEEWLREEVRAKSLGLQEQYEKAGLPEKLGVSWNELWRYGYLFKTLNRTEEAMDAFIAYVEFMGDKIQLDEVESLFSTINIFDRRSGRNGFFEALTELIDGVNQGEVSEEVVDLNIFKKIVGLNSENSKNAIVALRELGEGVKAGEIGVEALDLQLIRNIIDLSDENAAVAFKALKELGAGVNNGTIRSEVLNISFFESIFELKGEYSKPILYALTAIAAAVRNEKAKEELLELVFFEKINELAESNHASAFHDLGNLVFKVVEEEAVDGILDKDLLVYIAKFNKEGMGDVFDALGELAVGVKEEKVPAKFLDLDFLKEFISSSAFGLNGPLLSLIDLGERLKEGKASEEFFSLDFINQVAKVSGIYTGEAIVFLTLLEEAVKAGKAKEEVLTLDLIEMVIIFNERKANFVFYELWDLIKGVMEKGLSVKLLDLEFLKTILEFSKGSSEGSLKRLKELGGAVKEGEAPQEVLDLELLKTIAKNSKTDTPSALIQLRSLGKELREGVEVGVLSEEFLEVGFFKKVTNIAEKNTSKAFYLFNNFGEAIRLSEAKAELLDLGLLEKILKMSGENAGSVLSALTILVSGVASRKIRHEVLDLNLLKAIANKSGVGMEKAIKELGKLGKGIISGEIVPKVLDMDLLIQIVKSSGQEAGDVFNILSDMGSTPKRGVKHIDDLDVELLKKISKISGARTKGVFEVFKELSLGANLNNEAKELIKISFFEFLVSLPVENPYLFIHSIKTLISSALREKSTRRILDESFLIEVSEQMSEKPAEFFRVLIELGKVAQEGGFRKNEILDIVRRVDEIGIDKVLRQLEQLGDVWENEIGGVVSNDDRPEDEWLDRREIDAKSLGALRQVQSKAPIETLSFELLKQNFNNESDLRAFLEMYFKTRMSDEQSLGFWKLYQSIKSIPEGLLRAIELVGLVLESEGLGVEEVAVGLEDVLIAEENVDYVMDLTSFMELRRKLPEFVDELKTRDQIWVLYEGEEREERTEVAKLQRRHSDISGNTQIRFIQRDKQLKHLRGRGSRIKVGVMRDIIWNSVKEILPEDYVTASYYEEDGKLKEGMAPLALKLVIARAKAMEAGSVVSPEWIVENLGVQGVRFDGMHMVIDLVQVLQKSIDAHRMIAQAA